MKALFLIIRLGLLWLVGGWLATVLTAALHEWWPLVPRMGFVTGLKVYGVFMLWLITAAVIGALKALGEAGDRRG